MNATGRRSSSPLPLVAIGALLAAAGWLVAERVTGGKVHVPATARTIEARGALADFEQTTIRIFEDNAPSVVHITSRAIVADRFRRATVSEGTGTGFVWDERGYVVSNWHVVQSLDSDLLVRFPGGEDRPAIVVGGAEEFDIAVLKLVEVPSGLRPIPLGSAQDLKVGQSVFAIGNPFGLTNSLTTGVVSALDRVIKSPRGTLIQGAIQVDAAINPGNSGGPLLDSAGRLIGMNTAIVSPSGGNAGIGFAIPADTINRTVPSILRGDRGVRPVLGVVLERVLVGESEHPVVREIVPGSGAETAGLRSVESHDYGDVILAIDDKLVHSFDDVLQVLDSRQVGDKVKLRILRRQERAWVEREVEVVLGAAAKRR